MSTAITPNLNVGNTFDLGTLKFWALGDRLLVQEDEFRTGYECSQCDGTCRVACTECDGTGKSPRVKSARCSTCTGEGTIICPSCNGKGGLLIAPQESERRPTTGVIVSLGDGCQGILKLGQSVMYSNFCGYVVDLVRAGKKISIRILHESEVLCGMEGQLDLKGLRGKSEIAEFSK